MSMMIERVAAILCDELNVTSYADLPERAIMHPDKVFASKAAARLTAERLIEAIPEISHDDGDTPALPA